MARVGLQRETCHAPMLAVLTTCEQVHGHRLQFVDGRNFDIADDLRLSLTQSGRLLLPCLGHSRVVRCDFMKS